MITIENVVLPAKPWLVGVARGMRNSYNSWDKMDTTTDTEDFIFGPNDYDLAKKLVKAGPSHAKFMRMIPVIFDVTGPFYWWKEMDTYKIGTVRNSCSTMHKIMDKEFTSEYFSYPFNNDYPHFDQVFLDTLDILNACRIEYAKEKDPVRKKEIWNFLIAHLPSSYNQKSTMTMSYAVLANIYNQRKDHKLTEWHQFCDWIETLPMHDLITGELDMKVERMVEIETNDIHVNDRIHVGKYTATCQNEETIQDVFDTFNEKQRLVLNYIVGKAVEDEETILDVLGTFNEKQRLVLNYIVDKAVEDAKKRKTSESNESENDNTESNEEDKKLKHNVFDTYGSN